MQCGDKYEGQSCRYKFRKFFYQDGNLISDYKADIDLVWTACEKSVTELKATDIQKERKISTGIIKAVIQDEKVTIKVEYVDKDLTSVSVFVGAVGNNMASRLIHEKIIGNLATTLIHKFMDGKTRRRKQKTHSRICLGFFFK